MSVDVFKTMQTRSRVTGSILKQYALPLSCEAPTGKHDRHSEKNRNKEMKRVRPHKAMINLSPIKIF